MILMPSCSELVCHMDVYDLDDIKYTLKHIEKNTNLIVGLKSVKTVFSDTPLDSRYGENYKVDIHKINIDDIELYGHTTDYRQVPIDDINLDEASGINIGIKAEHLDKDILNKFVYSLYKSDNYINILLCSKEYDSSLSISLGDGYCDNKGLTFQCTQHCASNEFPILLLLLENYNCYYESHDGGSTSSFDEWCSENGTECLGKKSEGEDW